ncbi:hypothetical protein TNCV_3976361 [Trichonephila clavipes]|nr:hypothetical protein TNCV_3976361 [Trichonephila clavipes]
MKRSSRSVAEAVDLHDAKNRQRPIRNDYVACKRSLEYLFDMGTPGKIKFQARFCIVRAQVLPSGEKDGHQNYLQRLISHLYGAAQKKDIRASGAFTRSVM